MGPGVGAADADVVEPPGVAQGDGAVGADGVGADAVVGVGGAVAGGGFGPGGVGGGGGGAAGQGPVRAAGVVVGGEGVQLLLESGEGGGGRAGGQPFLQGLLESFDFALGLGVAGRPFFWVTPRRRSSFSRALRPPRPPASRVVQTMPLSVRVEAGMPCFAQAARKVARVTSPVVTGCAVTDRASREWSSIQDTISASVPSARCQWMKSDCHRSLGSSAANRM